MGVTEDYTHMFWRLRTSLLQAVKANASTEHIAELLDELGDIEMHARNPDMRAECRALIAKYALPLPAEVAVISA
jgi:hypothetical protein